MKLNGESLAGLIGTQGCTCSVNRTPTAGRRVCLCVEGAYDKIEHVRRLRSCLLRFQLHGGGDCHIMILRTRLTLLTTTTSPRNSFFRTISRAVPNYTPTALQL